MRCAGAADAARAPPDRPHQVPARVGLTLRCLRRGRSACLSGAYGASRRGPPWPEHTGRIKNVPPKTAPDAGVRLICLGRAGGRPIWGPEARTNEAEYRTARGADAQIATTKAWRGPTQA